MQALPWPDELEDVLLAKSADRSEGGKPESLARHTWLVLSRLADFIRLRPNLPFQVSQPRLWHILYWATFLHDFGKAMPGFQGVLRGDAAQREQWGKHRHEVFSLAFLDWITEGLTDEECLWAVAAIISHHRDRAEIMLSYSLIEDLHGRDPLLRPLESVPEDHIDGLGRWLSTCGWPWAQNLQLDKLGVESVEVVPATASAFVSSAASRIRCWLEEYDEFVDRLGRRKFSHLLVPLLALRGLLINADHSASAHAPALPQVEFSAGQVLTSRNIDRVSLFNHQTDSEQKTGSALLIAPTGSGKTEAALLWAAGQATDGSRPPRLFYTLPYQASMNAMQKRLQETFDDEETLRDPEKKPSKVGLQHGRALLALYRDLMEREEDPRKAARVARWMKNLNQLNYPPVRVFSPYQMLKAMYRLKGYEAQLTDYHNALFVFDEIHAYEVNRLALILKSIAYLRQYYNARFFIMSATFPTIIKSWLQQALAIEGDAEIVATPSLFARFQRHRLRVREGELLGNLGLIEADVRAGKSVLVVCNVIANAQQVFQEIRSLLKDTDVEVMLLHGNFNLRDRKRKEGEIQRYTGSRSNERKQVFLVATQVVEVSLDIDLDAIYTEPAPLEALVQRFGRVNRRGAMKDAQGSSILADVHIFTEPDDGQGIYNQLLIRGTLDILRRENGKPIDENAVGGWLDEIYAGEVEALWKEEFEKCAAEFELAVLKTLRPFQSSADLKDLFYKAFDGIDVLPDDLLTEYYDLIEQGQKIATRELTVSISWKRYYTLRGKGLIKSDDEADYDVVAAPYSPEIGLDLSQI